MRGAGWAWPIRTLEPQDILASLVSDDRWQAKPKDILTFYALYNADTAFIAMPL